MKFYNDLLNGCFNAHGNSHFMYSLRRPLCHIPPALMIGGLHLGPEALCCVLWLALCYMVLLPASGQHNPLWQDDPRNRMRSPGLKWPTVSLSS